MTQLPHFDDPAAAAAWGLYQQDQAAEYGTYVAAQDIPVGAVLGFRRGDAVPKSTAEREGWDVSGWVIRTEDAAPPEDRAAQLRERQAALAAEQERLARELEAVEAATVPQEDGPPPGESEAEAVLEEAPAGDGYDAMTVEQLRQLLTERGLPTSGTKAELIARLRAADTEE